MGAIKDLWASERGLLATLLVIACTVLCALGSITNEQWLDYTRWVFATYAVTKTVTGAVAIAKGTNTKTSSISTIGSADNPAVIATATATTVTDSKPPSS